VKIRTLCLVVLLLLHHCCLIPLLPGTAQEKSKSLLMVISPADVQKRDAIESIHSYYERRGIQFETALNSDFSSAEALKEYLQKQHQTAGLSDLILPVRGFQSKITVDIHGTAYEFISDKYFANLDNDKLWTSEISVARASVDEMYSISKRSYATEVQMDIAFPMINYMRSQGKCWIYYEVDPSQMGAELKKQAQAKGYQSFTYFEAEGDRSSGQKSDYPLNEATISNAKGNLSFYLSTIEILNPDADGSAEIQIYPHFMRAILHDKNKSGAVDPGEVEITKFYSYHDTSSLIHRIGILPLFDNSQLNLNSFSSIISHEYPGNSTINFGQGSGTTASYLAVLRLVAENILAGKTTGQSIDVYRSYKEKFSLDLYNQELFALTLFVRGDPTLSIGDLTSSPMLELKPAEVLHFGISPMVFFTLNNKGNVPLEWVITEHPSWLWAIPRSGSILPTKNQQVLLWSPSWLYGRQEGIVKIKSNDPLQPEIQLKVVRGWSK
jgi:hypothetical protein